MKKIILVIGLALLLSFQLYSQSTTRPVGEPDPSKVGIDSAQQRLIDITVTKFEDSAFWYAAMPEDQGVIAVRQFPGITKGKRNTG